MFIGSRMLVHRADHETKYMKIQPRPSSFGPHIGRGFVQIQAGPSGAKTAFMSPSRGPKPESSEFIGNLVQDIVFLRRFMTEQGKILSRRSTGITAKEQRKISKAIKNARLLGLLQFVHTR